MASPRPVPVASGRASTRANSSKMRSRSPSGTPGPWSATRTTTLGVSVGGDSVAGVADTRISVPGGANFNAFSNRLPKTCSIISMSTSTVATSGAMSRRTRCARASGRSRRTAACARSGSVDRLATNVERAGPDPAELEDVGHEPFEAVGLVVDRVEELGAVRGIEVEVGRPQGGRRRLDRRERGAQVVGDRGEEPRSGPTDLRGDPRLAGDRLEPEPVDGCGEAGDQRLEERAVRRVEWTVTPRGGVDLERDDPYGDGRPGSARRRWHGPWNPAPRTVHSTRLNNVTRASAAPATTVSGSSPASSRVVRSRRICVSRSRCSRGAPQPRRGVRPSNSTLRSRRRTRRARPGRRPSARRSSRVAQ